MSNIFYTPPAADLQSERDNQPAFFTVAPRKLFVMILLTLGMYCTYWVYKNWAIYRTSSGRPLWPIARTLFSVFYLPSLFYKIHVQSSKTRQEGIAGWLLSFVALVILQGNQMLINLYAERVLGMSRIEVLLMGPELHFSVMIISLALQALILVRIQGFINRLNQDPEGQANRRYTPLNVVWMGVALLPSAFSYYWFAQGVNMLEEAANTGF